MPINDDLSEYLEAKAASIDVEPITLAGVKQRWQRRNRRNRLVAVAAVFALVVGAGAGLRALTDDDPGADVAVGVAGHGAVDGAVEGSADQPGSPPLTATTAPAPAGADAGASGSTSVAVSSDYGGDSKVVPWGEGFLSWSVVRESPSLDSLDPAVADKFPPEIIKVIQDAGATTLEESMDALRAAGLLELATRIVTDDPELMDLYSQATAQTTTRFVAQASADGVTWKEIDTSTWPVSGQSFRSVTSDGSHLLIGEVVAEGSGEPGSAIAIRIYVTTDLGTWTTFDLTPPDVSLGSPHVQSNVSISRVAIGPNGWAAIVDSNSWLDIDSLLPIEIRDRGNYGVDYTDDGLVVRIYSGTDTSPGDLPVPATTIDPAGARLPLPPNASGEVAPVDTIRFTWDELGIDGSASGPDIFGDQTVSTIFVADWGGVPSVVAGATGLGRIGQIVGTDTGFVALMYGTGPGEPNLAYSPDGRFWQTIATPSIQRIDSLVAVDGGVVVSGGPDGVQNLWLGGPDGTGLVPITVPDIPAGTWIGLNPGSSQRGTVSIVDVTGYPPYDPFAVDFDVTVENEGMSVTLGQRADGSAWVKVIDLATGEVVLDRQAGADGAAGNLFSTDADSLILNDEAGNPVVSLPVKQMSDRFSAARDAAMAAAASERPVPPELAPDFRVVASRDGANWLVTPLAAGIGSYVGSMAINGNTLVVEIGSEFQTFTLP